MLQETVNRGEYIKFFIIGTFFSIFFLIGCLVFADYGVSYDEPLTRQNLLVSYKYIFGNNVNDKVKNYLSDTPYLHDYWDKDYGVAMLSPLVAVEGFFDFSMPTRQMYLMYHLYNFIIFFISVIFLYKLCRLSFADWFYSLVVCIIYVLTPRFFAESFYNNKDILFCSIGIICVYYNILFITAGRNKNVILAGLCTAFAMNTRITAIIFPVLTIFSICVCTAGVTIYNKGELLRQIKNGATKISLYLSLICLFFYIITPTSWKNPIEYFFENIKSFSHFRWSGEVLFLGEIIKGTELPWYYIPVWIIITTPLVIIVLFLIGTIYLCYRYVRYVFILNNPYLISNLLKRALVFYEYNIVICYTALIVYGSVATIIIEKPVLYDGWRHMYFIYPYIVIIAVYGLFQILARKEKSRYQNLLSGLVIYGLLFSMVTTMGWMIANHPYQYVYFSRLFRSYVADNFEKDYWCVSIRNLLEQFPIKDGVSDIGASPCVGNNYNILSDNDRKRIRSISEKYDYGAHHYRFIPNSKFKTPENYEEVYSIIVDGYKISSLFKYNNLADKHKRRFERTISREMISSVIANYNQPDAYNMIDYSSGAKWQSKALQSNDMVVEIQFHDSVSVNRLRLDCLDSQEDYPIGINIFYTVDNVTWKEVTNLTRINDIEYFFDSIKCKAIKIRQTGHSDRFWWTIGDLRFYEPL